MRKYTALHVMPFVIFTTHFWVQFCQTISLLVVHFHHMQNTAGKLMEHTITRKLTRDLEDRKILPVNQGGSDQESAHEKMQLHFHICTEDFRGKNKQWLWQSVSRMLTTESSSSC